MAGVEDVVEVRAAEQLVAAEAAAETVVPGPSLEPVDGRAGEDVVAPVAAARQYRPASCRSTARMSSPGPMSASISRLEVRRRRTPCRTGRRLRPCGSRSASTRRAVGAGDVAGRGIGARARRRRGRCPAGCRGTARSPLIDTLTHSFAVGEFVWSVTTSPAVDTAIVPAHALGASSPNHTSVPINSKRHPCTSERRSQSPGLRARPLPSIACRRRSSCPGWRGRTQSWAVTGA